MTTIYPCCPKCRSIRIVMPTWYRDDAMYVWCSDCGHSWNAAG